MLALASVMDADRTAVTKPTDEDTDADVLKDKFGAFRDCDIGT